MDLIDATPSRIQPINGNGWMFSYGEPVIGQETGAAFLISGNPHYTRFKIVVWRDANSDEQPLPAYQPIYERPLTDAEIAHLQRLANEVEVSRKNS